MRYIFLLIFLTGCCRFESNTSDLLRKRVEANEATINLARKSDSVIAAKLYEDAITRSSAQLGRIADILEGNDK